MRLKTLARALFALALCLLGGMLMAAVLGLVWHMPAGVFVVTALFFGVVPWLSFVTPTRRTAEKRGRDAA